MNCGIIRDLLPLYAEDICGEETKLAVEEHLKGCANCRARLEDMKASDSAALISALPHKAVSKKIKKNQFRLIALAVCAVMFMVVGYMGRTAQPKPVPYSEDFKFSITRDENGDILLTYDDSLIPFSVEGQEDSYERSDPIYVYSVFFEKAEERFPAQQSRIRYWDLPWKEADSASEPLATLQPNQLRLSGHGDRDVKIYYANPDSAAVLLYADPDFGMGDSYGIAFLPRLAQNYYLFMMGFVFLALALLSLIFKLFKKTKASRVFLYISFFPLSYVISHFAVKGTSNISWDILLDLRYILIAAAFASASMILTAAHVRTRRQAQSRADQTK